MNVKKGIRKRSIPLEPSECYRVRVGDLVLCFQVICPSTIFGHVQSCATKTKTQANVVSVLVQI